jgi:hypothetical protein
MVRRGSSGPSPRSGAACRSRVHKHRNPFAHAPERLHDEITANYNDMTYAATPEAKADVFDHIERLHYPKRRHSTIGYLSPIEFER